jgi:hypothetical protein
VRRDAASAAARLEQWTTINPIRGQTEDVVRAAPAICGEEFTRGVIEETMVPRQYFSEMSSREYKRQR